MNDEQLLALLRARPLPELTRDSQERLLAELELVEIDNATTPSAALDGSRSPWPAVGVGLTALAAAVAVIVWLASARGPSGDLAKVDLSSQTPAAVVGDPSDETIVVPVPEESLVAQGSGNASDAEATIVEQPRGRGRGASPNRQGDSEAASGNVADIAATTEPRGQRRGGGRGARPIQWRVSEAVLILVGTIQEYEPAEAPQGRPPEILATMEVSQVLKGEYEDATIDLTIQAMLFDNDSVGIVGSEWIVLFSASALANREERRPGAFSGMMRTGYLPDVLEYLSEEDE